MCVRIFGVEDVWEEDVWEGYENKDQNAQMSSDGSVDPSEVDTEVKQSCQRTRITFHARLERGRE